MEEWAMSQRMPRETLWGLVGGTAGGISQGTPSRILHRTS